MIEIKNKRDCCGCTACEEKCPQHCIYMRDDGEGFRYPVADPSLCIQCGLCEKVCPVLHPQKSIIPDRAYAAWNRNETVRKESSSGGIFTLLAEQTIATGGIVFGARFDEVWHVVHGYADTKEGIASFKGSKYTQSDMKSNFRDAEQFLKQGRNVLFSGTPCQIAGLKGYLRKDYQNLLTVDFICHGVPSPGLWNKYLKEVIASQDDAGKNTVLSSLKSMSEITGINFRDKSAGWKKYGFLLFGKSAVRADRNSVLSCYKPSEEVWVKETLDKNAFLKLFLSDICLRPICYACPFRTGRSHSDIKLADFWGIDRLYPQLFDDKGVSWVAAMSEKGKEILKTIKDRAMIYPCDFSTSISFNPSFSSSCAPHPQRKAFFKNMNRLSVKKLAKKYCSVSLGKRIWIKLKSVIKKMMIWR